MVGILAAHLFRGHVTNSSYHCAGIRDLFLRFDLRTYDLVALRLQLGQSEVEYLEAAIVSDEQVLRLEITMHDGFFVCGGETQRDLLRVIKCFARRKCAITKKFSQFLAFEQFGDDKGCSLVSADIVDGQNVWMIECGSGASFLLEPSQPIRVQSERGGQELDRDFTIQAGIARAVDLAHTACANLADNRVMSKRHVGRNGFAHGVMLLTCLCGPFRRFHTPSRYSGVIRV